jgi:hypothetical protein
MIHVVLDHDTGGEPFYCPFCGKATLPRKKPFNSKENVCKHLLYLGTAEGGLEYCKKKAEALVEEYEDSGDEDDLIGIDITNAVHFSLCETAPSSFGVFIGYVKYLEEFKEKAKV